MVKSQNIKIYCGFANYVAIASNKVLQSFDAHNQSYINNFLPYLPKCNTLTAAVYYSH